MLIVHRKVGERIVVGGGIEITVTEVSARGVRLGITAPRGVFVLRGEVHDAVAVANAAASASLPAQHDAVPAPLLPPTPPEDP